MSFPVPTNETERLAAVRALNILDTAPEIAYDEIGELAAQICQCPVAYISFMDDDRLWLKAKYGLPPDFNQCPREICLLRDDSLRHRDGRRVRFAAGRAVQRNSICHGRAIFQVLLWHAAHHRRGICAWEHCA